MMVKKVCDNILSYENDVIMSHHVRIVYHAETYQTMSLCSENLKLPEVEKLPVAPIFSGYTIYKFLISYQSWQLIQEHRQFLAYWTMPILEIIKQAMVFSCKLDFSFWVFFFLQNI